MKYWASFDVCSLQESIIFSFTFLMTNLHLDWKCG